MKPVAVVTDSTHYLPREVVEAHGIRRVSLYVHWRGGQDREADLPDFDAFYAHLRSGGELPTTSQPSVGDFLEVFEPLLREGHDVLALTMSGGLSGTYESALSAREHARGLDGRIEVVDTVTTCGGFGMVAMAAAAAAQRGEDLDAVNERARAARAAMKMWFSIDTLEFLRRGGRIGAAQAWVGSTLRIKPILTLDEEVIPVERVRTAGRVFERMVAYLESRRDDGADGWVVQHIQAPERAEALADRGRELFGCEPLFVSEVGPVIGTYAGPGLLGIGALPAALLR